MLFQYQIPVAYSMIALVRQLSKIERQPFHEFMCYWTAFNNIYTAIAEQKGYHAQLKTKKDGTIRTCRNGNVQIPDIKKALTEREEIELVFNEFDETLKHDLVLHTSSAFFVYRVPQWHGRLIEFDGSGQKLNGVLNVGYTIEDKYPVWSPVDIQAYERYAQSKPQKGDKDLLAKQILFLIYTVRNNTFHGGKMTDDDNDSNVIKKAIPLLSMIVDHFIDPVACESANISVTYEIDRFID
jgi:hypothetical protein